MSAAAKKRYEEKRRTDPELKARRREVNYRRFIERRYGMSAHDYDQFLVEQRGACAICRRVPEDSFNVDHCHKLGKVRGLLCRKCNLALGHFEDDLASVFRAAAYLMQASHPVDA